MKRLRNIFILIASLVAMFACSKREHLEYEPKMETGQLKFGMNVDVILSETSPASRAAVDTKNFIVAVYDAKTKNIAKDVNNRNAVYTYSEMPEIITLYTGEYYILASSSDTMPIVAWETPFYQGKSDIFSIKNAAITEVLDINCTQQNVKVSVSCTDKLKKELTSYSSVISLSSNENAHLTFIEDESRSGYFKPGKLKAVLNGKRHNGDNVHAQAEIDSVKPGSHQNILFDVTLTGQLSLSIKINTDVDIIDKDITVPPDDSTIIDPAPGPEDPIDPDEPKPEDVLSIAGRNFDIDQAFEFPVRETREVVVDIEAKNKIYDLWVEIDSPFLTEEELESIGIPKKFNLCELSPSLKETFGPEEGLGLIGNEDVRGKSALEFDITQFTSLIFEAGIHKFIITVSDFDGYELQKTLMLVNY